MELDTLYEGSGRKSSSLGFFASLSYMASTYAGSQRIYHSVSTSCMNTPRSVTQHQTLLSVVLVFTTSIVFQDIGWNDPK